MTSYLPVTLDGREVPADAPRSQAMSDDTAQAVSAKAEELRELVLHCHFDLDGRTITLHAANAPEGPLAFSFGDGSTDVEQQVAGAGESASAQHTYAADGVYEVSVRTLSERWSTEAAVNWPQPFPEQEAPPEEA